MVVQWKAQQITPAQVNPLDDFETQTLNAVEPPIRLPDARNLWWMDEGTGTTVADQEGNNNGTLESAGTDPLPAWKTSPFTYLSWRDTIEGFIGAGAGPSFTTGDEITIGAWIRFPSLGTNTFGDLMGIRDNTKTGNPFFDIRFGRNSGTELHWRIRGQDGIRRDAIWSHGTGVVDDDQWHLVLLEASSGATTIIFDDVQRASVAGPDMRIDLSGVGWVIGARELEAPVPPTTANGQLKGDVAGVFLVNRLFSSAWKTALFNRGPPLKGRRIDGWTALHSGENADPSFDGRFTYWTVRDDPTGSRAIRIQRPENTVASHFVLTHDDDPGGDTVERLMRVKNTSGPFDVFNVLLRGDKPTQGDLNGYAFGIRTSGTDRVRIWRLFGGSGQTILAQTTALDGEIVSDEYFWLRARADGDDLSFKVWKDGDPEPVGWTLTYDTSGDGTKHASGFCGIHQRQIGSTEEDYVDDYTVVDEGASVDETGLLDVRVRDAFAGHSSEARLLIDDPNGTKHLDYPEHQLVELHVTPSGQPETRRFTGTVADAKRQGQGEVEVTLHPHSQWLQKQSILIDFGSRIEQLPSITTGGTDIRDAAVSPDGDHVAFVGNGFGPSPGDTPGRVFKKEDDTYTPVTLLPTVGGNHNVESRAAAYSPDGVHLAVAYVGENFDEQGLAIFKRDGDTYTLIQEFGDPDVQVGNIAMMTYSPDGEHLAFGSIGIPDLFVFKRDGDTYTIIESLNTGRRVSYVSYHPDGDHLAVGRGDGGNTDVVPAIKIFERDGDNYTEVVGLDDVWLRPDDSNGDFDRGLVNYGDDGGLVASVSNEGFAVDATDLYSRRANTYKRTDGFDSSPMLDFEFNHIREIQVHRDSGILAAESDDPETLSFFLRRGRRYLHVKDFDISAEPSGRQEPRFSHDGDHLLIPIWFSGDVLVFALGEFLGDILEEMVTTLTPLIWEPGNVKIANNRRVLRDWRGMKLLDVLVELSAVSENDEFGVTMDREFFWRAKDSLGAAPGAGLMMGEHLDQEAEFSEDTRRRVNRVTVNYGEGTAARRVVLNDTPHQEQLQSRIGSSGPVVEELVVTHTEITREADALSKARELMTQRGNTESGVLVSWDRFDYRPGMSVPVESDVHGVDKTMSIAFLEYAWNDDETRVGVARDYEGLIDLLDSLGSDQGRVENRETRGEVPTSTHEV